MRNLISGRVLFPVPQDQLKVAHPVIARMGCVKTGRKTTIAISYDSLRMTGLRATSGKAQEEQMLSALARKADIASLPRYVRSVPLAVIAAIRRTRGYGMFGRWLTRP